MTEIIVSERSEKCSYITYLYNAAAALLKRNGGRGDLRLGTDRTELILTVERGEKEIRQYLAEKLTEILCVGYKADFLKERLHVTLGPRETRLFAAALIAADLNTDGPFIRKRLIVNDVFCIDGFYNFRLAALREKWERIVDCLPAAFTVDDLISFCDYLAADNKRTVYVKENAVFGENFLPLRRSKLMGEEDLETEIMLADAGYVYCIGKVDPAFEHFLRKYYAERAVFS